MIHVKLHSLLQESMVDLSISGFFNDFVVSREKDPHGIRMISY
jgi:hypothetical protein